VKTIKIHVAPGVDARAAARELLKTGAVGIDDIGENHDVVREEILDELGHAGDGIDLRTQRIDTPLGPVFVLRNVDVWSAADAKKAVLFLRASVHTRGRVSGKPIPVPTVPSALLSTSDEE
jgi:hypothetical protein